MGNIKLNKLFSTLERDMGKQKNFTISAKKVNVMVNGELHKIDNQYCFTRGAGRVVIAQKKSGSILSWKGTYKKYSVKFMVGTDTLAEFDIPEKATLKLGDLE